MFGFREKNSRRNGKKSENFGIFQKTRRKMKEKSFLRRKMFKIFACGAQKWFISKVFWFKTGPNSLKSPPKGAKFFGGRFFLDFRKSNKKHCGGVASRYPNATQTATGFHATDQCFLFLTNIFVVWSATLRDERQLKLYEGGSPPAPPPKLPVV